MSLSMLFAAWSVALTVAGTSVLLLLHPLRALLTDICGTRDRASFWTLYACILVILAPLLTVSFPGLLDRAADVGPGAVLQQALFYALTGVIGALMIMGYAIWKPVAMMLHFRKTETRPIPPNTP